MNHQSENDRLIRPIVEWADRARNCLARGELQETDLDSLVEFARRTFRQIAGSRQRLLYLHASSPSIRSPAIGWAFHEPVPTSVTQIDPEDAEIPYKSVHAAIVDGWKIIHFPSNFTQICPKSKGPSPFEK